MVQDEFQPVAEGLLDNICKPTCQAQANVVFVLDDIDIGNEYFFYVQTFTESVIKKMSIEYGLMQVGIMATAGQNQVTATENICWLIRYIV